jgi:AraC-like DNA-binding protein
MSFAPRIRKEILRVLDQHVIPALEGTTVPLLIAEPPYNFASAGQTVLQKEFLPDKSFAPLQIEQQWTEEMVMSANVATFVFSYQGVCYERVGITQAQSLVLDEAQRAKASGLTVLRLEAPTLLCYPAYTLRSRGVPRPEAAHDTGCALGWILLPNRVLLFMNQRGPEAEFTTHLLEIEDELLIKMNQLAMDLMRRPHQAHCAQLQYLSVMYFLREHLHHHKPNVSNSSWVGPEVYLPVNTEGISAKNQELCYQAIEYIIINLHHPLSLQGIARRFGVSQPHLNALFQQAHGMTVMRYVTRIRVEAARRILEESAERVSDVAALVGFSSVSSFSAVFHRQTGHSPNQYRKRRLFLNEK